MIFDFFGIFFKIGVGPNPAQPFGLGQNWPGPKWEANYLVAACRMNSACSDCSSEQRGRLMQGRDGEPPEVVRACGRDGGEDGDFSGGCNSGGRRWSQREEERLQGREIKTFTVAAPPLVNRLLVQDEGLYGGADGGEYGVFAGGCNSGGRRWSQREEETLQGRERRSRWLLHHWQTVCWCRRKASMVELMVEKLVVAPVGGWNGGEREGEKNCRNGPVGAGFLSTLDSIFSSLRPSRETLFIVNGRR